MRPGDGAAGLRLWLQQQPGPGLFWLQQAYVTQTLRPVKG